MLAQETLRESEERFRLIADSAPVPIWVTKLDRSGLRQPGLCRFRRICLSSRRSTSTGARCCIRTTAARRCRIGRGRSHPKPFVLEARYRRADGEWRWLRSESRSRAGTPPASISASSASPTTSPWPSRRRIELRRLNETLEERIFERTAELESNEAPLRAILETSNQYQGLVNHQGDVFLRQQDRADRHPRRARGRHRKAVLGNALVQRRRRACARGCAMPSTPCMRGEEVQDWRCGCDLARRRARFRVRMRPVRDHHGNITGAVPEAVDITERRAARKRCASRRRWRRSANSPAASPTISTTC